MVAFDLISEFLHHNAEGEQGTLEKSAEVSGMLIGIDDKIYPGRVRMNLFSQAEERYFSMSYESAGQIAVPLCQVQAVIRTAFGQGH